MTATIIHGDCLDVLRGMADAHDTDPTSNEDERG